MMNLQMFAEAVQGKKLVYLYRVASTASTTDGAILALTTENSRTVSKDADSKATKDGSIRTPGATEVEISATSILAKGDTMIKALETAMNSDSLIEIWEANLDEKVGSTGNKYKGKYFQGYITEMEYSASAEDFVEVTLKFGINGAGVDGEVTVPADQAAAALYSFADTPKTSA